MAFICEHHEELELDLHAQDVDLLDVWRGELSFRRVELLIRNLPPDSATVRAINPDAAELAAWDVAEYQRAVLIDMYGRVHFKNYRPMPRPAEAVNNRRRTQARHAALERQAERVRQQTTR